MHAKSQATPFWQGTFYIEYISHQKTFTYVLSSNHKEKWERGNNNNPTSYLKRDGN